MIKACVYCRHCYYDEPYNYSTLTVGGGSFDCMKGKWSSISDLRDGDLYVMAQECEYFDFTDAIKEIQKKDGVS